MKKDFAQLRERLDSNDPFMSGGHQIMKTAGATQHNARLRRIPVWANNDEQIRQLLLQSFPKLATDPKQRHRAGRWLQVIHLYYRVGYTRGHIAVELKITEDQVRDLIRNITRAANGKRADGTGKRGIRPIGRPKKIHAPIETTMGPLAF